MKEHFPQAAGVTVDDRGTSILIEIDPLLYPEDVALKAAYWLTAHCHIHVGRSPEGKLVAEVRTKDGMDGPALTDCCGEFCNTLIDFAVRARVSVETECIQEALLQRAFLSLVPKPGGSGSNG